VVQAYRTTIDAIFVDTPVSLDGLWSGMIGGGAWVVSCQNQDCQGAADYPGGAARSIQSTGVVSGGQAFEELMWDVCPPDAAPVAGKAWTTQLPATRVDSSTVSWEGRRHHTITSLSPSGIMTVQIAHETRIAYSFGVATTTATHPWIFDGQVSATVDVSGPTPKVTSLTASFLGPHQSGSMSVTALGGGSGSGSGSAY
jgi:hypothetical protein